MKQNDSKIHGPAVLTGKFIKICLPQEAQKTKTKKITQIQNLTLYLK